MIKYVEYDSFDETGQHIIPVNTLYHMNKTAAGSYSPEIMRVILNMKRKPDLFYVVINALGSYEIWGANRNGDAFPEIGLNHKSLRTDMGTLNDYGYKTFEYYAKLFRHHVNKSNSPSFGEVVFSHYNPTIQRVELVVGINTESGADIIKSIQLNENVSVSMGCKVKHDRCSICGNEAKTRATYCKHLKNYMKQIVPKELAAKWSKELGKTILPGAQVFAYNDRPRFFDISKVHIGADRTSYVLGKAASDGLVIHSTDIAEAMGVTDRSIDKLAMFGKKSEIKKTIGGALGPGDIDGTVTPVPKPTVFRKALNEKVKASIAEEPTLPKPLLNSMSALPLKTILSTMLGMGIYPKPAELQRIIVVKIGRRDIADKLDDNNEVFDYNNDSCPHNLNLSNNHFSDTLGQLLAPHLSSRSFFPSFMKPRIQAIMVKSAGYNALDSVANRPLMEESKINPLMLGAGGLAGIYAGLKLKSMGYGPRQFAETFARKPWLRALIGGGVMYKIYDTIDKSNASDPMFLPASSYENALQDTNFSGHIKTSGDILDSIMLPASYLSCAKSQVSMNDIGNKQFIKTNQTMMKTSSLLSKIDIDDMERRVLNLLPTL